MSDRCGTERVPPFQGLRNFPIETLSTFAPVALTAANYTTDTTDTTDTLSNGKKNGANLAGANSRILGPAKFHQPIQSPDRSISGKSAN